MIISIEKKIENIKIIMEDIVKKLQKENKELKKLLYEKSDYIKKLNDNKYDLFICKIDYLSIRRGFLKYKKIKQKSDSKIKEIKEYNLSNIYNNFSDRLSEIENEFDEWCKIPKCTKCDCIFDNKNYSFDVKRHDLYQLCKECIGDELKKIIKKKKILKEVDEEHKNSKFIRKLCSKNYVYLNYYKELYINNQEEKYNLYDPSIIAEAGFNPEYEHDKYKLNNLCYRSNQLINLFGDKIQFFDIPESDLARIGKMEFQALCDVLYEIVGGYSGYENIMDMLNIGNNEASSDIESDNENDYIPELPDSDYEDEIDTDICIKCGKPDILPGNNKCVTCKFSNSINIY